MSVRAGGQGLRILVVEDDESIAEFVELALTEMRHQVVVAPHGRSALDVLAQGPVDLVLLDMRMPVMDGWTFASVYRERPGRKAPIVVMTAAADAARRAAEIGADAVLPKPFGLDQLHAVVERAGRG